MQSSTFSESLALLRTRRFGTFFFASLLSNIGTWAQQVAEPWLLLSLGASPFLVGLDAFALSAPTLLLTLVGGVLADRADRRRVIATFQSAQMLCPTLLVGLLLTGTVRPWIVIVLSLVVGATDALSMPSFQTILPSIVERTQIPSGLALNSTQFNLSRILGPSLAGVLMASVGAVGCFVVSAASYVPFIAVALWVLPRGKATPPSAETFDRSQLFAGIRAIARDPYLRGALLTVLATSMLCAPLVTFSPVVVRDVFHKDASLFSFAVGSFGLGALLGAIWLLSVDAARDRRHLSSGFALGYGTILVLVALNPWFWGLPVLLGLAGFSMSISNTSANSLLQTTASLSLRGQAISLYMLAMGSGISFGNLLTGVSVSRLGVTNALLLNGSLAVVAHASVGRQWFRSLQPHFLDDSRARETM
ncbi:MAG: MFS transporter [Acidobacteriia bacterium]|nr:MFS transporter [Terriglobia bacterium]